MSAGGSAPVIIVGAGPNGLMLASELALAGIKPVVLDCLPGPSDEPKANGLVGQVIRQLDMRDLYHAFGGAEGPPQPVPGWAFAGMPMSFIGLDDNPMHALRIPQARLVELLVQRARDLDVDVHWGHEFTDFSLGEEGISVTVSAGQQTLEFHADYLVGADGGRSAVRRCAGIEFLGCTTPTVSRMAHVSLPTSLLTPGGWYEIPGFGPLPFGHNRRDNGTVILFPFEVDRQLLGTTEYRDATTTADGPMTLDELQDSVSRILGVDVPIAPPAGPGPHALRRIDGQNTRQAQQYRAGRVLLLGDSAHVHSPTGGPGLNLGLQDAVNLGWKLAAEVNGWAPAGLLDSYQSERYPVGQRVMMQSLSQIALMAPGPEVGALRTLFAELADKREVAGHIAGLLAGSDVRYDVGDEHPLSGRLVPDLSLYDGRRVAGFLHAARPLVLDLCGGAAAASAHGWGSRVDVVMGRLPPGIDSPAAILIRPDGYVAWAADAFEDSDQERMHSALERWFGSPVRL